MGRTSSIRRAEVYRIIQLAYPRPVTAAEIQTALPMLYRSQIEACIRRLETQGRVQTQVILSEQEVLPGGNGDT